MKYLIDTNVFLRLLVNDEPKTYKDCLALFKIIKVGKIEAVTTNLNLAEIAWTLKSYYKLSKPNVVKSVRSILNLNGLDIVDGYDQALAIQLFEKHNIKYVDALLSSIKEVVKKEWAIVSYDKDFDVIGVVRKEPSEIIVA